MVRFRQSYFTFTLIIIVDREPLSKKSSLEKSLSKKYRLPGVFPVPYDYDYDYDEILKSDGLARLFDTMPSRKGYSE